MRRARISWDFWDTLNVAINLTVREAFLLRLRLMPTLDDKLPCAAGYSSIKFLEWNKKKKSFYWRAHSLFCFFFFLLLSFFFVYVERSHAEYSIPNIALLKKKKIPPPPHRKRCDIYIYLHFMYLSKLWSFPVRVCVQYLKPWWTIKKKKKSPVYRFIGWKTFAKIFHKYIYFQNSSVSFASPSP